MTLTYLAVLLVAAILIALLTTWAVAGGPAGIVTTADVLAGVAIGWVIGRIEASR